VLDKNPDYLVILPWHFREFFLKLPALKGKTLVFPLPNFEIVNL
jgi:NDP-4-keto-2,6-dideoxyhexose 3-C-methyltransferase